MPPLVAKSGLTDGFSQNIFLIAQPGNGNIGRGPRAPENLILNSAKICCRRNKPLAKKITFFDMNILHF